MEIEILRANARLSLARMYLRDLQNNADFGRMVDSRGSGFNCSRDRWIAFILKITEEAKPFSPESTALIVEQLKAICPDVVEPKTN